MAKRLPVDISYPRNVPLEAGAVFVVLPTLEDLASFWKANRDKLPYAAEDGGLVGEKIYLREYEWIFAPTVTGLVKAVTRWDQLGIKPRWYDWKTDEPDLYQACLRDAERFRNLRIKNGAWTAKDEREYRKNQSQSGWWILENLPNRLNDDNPLHVFADWIGEFSAEISDPMLAPEAVAELMQKEFFKSWHADVGNDSDVSLYSRAEMDKNVAYLEGQTTPQAGLLRF